MPACRRWRRVSSRSRRCPGRKPVTRESRPRRFVADPASGLLTVLTKMAPGARLPDHEHVMVEQTLVLEGALYCDEGVCKAGDFVWRPAGSRHEAWAGPEGCVALAMFQVPNRFYEGRRPRARFPGQRLGDDVGSEGAGGRVQAGHGIIVPHRSVCPLVSPGSPPGLPRIANRPRPALSLEISGRRRRSVGSRC